MPPKDALSTNSFISKSFGGLVVWQVALSGTLWRDGSIFSTSTNYFDHGTISSRWKAVCAQ